MDPLSIPSVIRSVLENLKSKDLSSCRLVNSSWNYEACKILQSRKTVYFTDLIDIYKFNWTFNSAIDKVSIRYAFFNFPFELFQNPLASKDFDKVRAILQALEEFYNMHGKYVLRLNYTLVLINSLDLTFEEDPNRSNILTLHYTQLFEMLFYHFPNLKDLRVLLRSNGLCTSLETFDVKKFAAGYESLEKKLNLQYFSIEFFKEENFSIHIGREDENQDDTRLSNSILFQTMLQFLMKAVFSKSPKLKFVSTNEATCNGMNSLIISNLVISQKSINALHTNGSLNQDVMHDLCLLENLTYFGGSVVHSDCIEAWSSFLYRHTNSLERTVIIFSGNFPTNNLCLPLSASTTMLKLNHLWLVNFEGNIQWKLFPELKTLILEKCDCSQIFRSLNPYIKSQSIPFGCPKCSKEGIQGSSVCPWSLRNLFVANGGKYRENVFAILNLPCCLLYHLTELTLTDFENLPLSKFFDECGMLRKLCLKNCRGITDSVICGMSKSILSWISPVARINLGEDNQRGIIRKMVEDAKLTFGNLRSNPFIGNLKCLQELTIAGEYSDTAIVFGISFCESLKVVKLHSKLLTWRTKLILDAVLLDLVHYGYEV